MSPLPPRTSSNTHPKLFLFILNRSLKKCLKSLGILDQGLGPWALLILTLLKTLLSISNKWPLLSVLGVYNDNTGVLVEVVFVELVWCSGGSVRPGTLDSLRWLLWWESCTCGPTDHILILRHSSLVLKEGSESLNSKRSRS